MEDTEWNDVLRAKGILPPRDEPCITEEQIINIMDEVIEGKLGDSLEDKTLDELDELEDNEDEEILREYRQKRFGMLICR